MSTATKLAQRTVHTGTFQGGQAQKLAQDTARKANTLAEQVAALQNRAYAALTTDSTAPLFTYATLLTANITTVLATGYLIVTFTASGAHITNPGQTYFQVLVDNVIKKGIGVTMTTGGSWSASIVLRTVVTRGPHVVLVQWNSDAASGRINAASTVEEHAHLLVQEAA